MMNACPLSGWLWFAGERSTTGLRSLNTWFLKLVWGVVEPLPVRLIWKTQVVWKQVTEVCTHFQFWSNTLLPDAFYKHISSAETGLPQPNTVSFTLFLTGILSQLLKSGDILGLDDLLHFFLIWYNAGYVCFLKV